MFFSTPSALPQPDGPFYAVGDIHGRGDLLYALLDLIEGDLRDQGLETAPIIFVGDAVDRGEDSQQVLDQLYRFAIELPDIVTCLMGNHEKMMLDFLDDPAGRGPRWLRNGGLQTLASYRVGGVSEGTEGARLFDAAAQLRQALPEGLEEWLRTLPQLWQSGDVVCVHAALDPAIPVEMQSARTLMWGHPEFRQTRRTDGLWVVFGHEVVDQPVIEDRRIAIDTGAVFTGCLTAAAVFPGAKVRFLST